MRLFRADHSGYIGPRARTVNGVIKPPSVLAMGSPGAAGRRFPLTRASSYLLFMHCLGWLIEKIRAGLASLVVCINFPVTGPFIGLSTHPKRSDLPMPLPMVHRKGASEILL